MMPKKNDAEWAFVPIVFLALIIFSGSANAISVGSLSATNEVWLGDAINVTAVCVNGTADRAYADISSPDMILPSLDMTSDGGGAYTLTVPGNYFTKKGTYSAVAGCVAGNATANASTTFIISEIKLDISSPASVYEQDIVEIVAVPKKNDAAITGGVSFLTTLDGAAIAPTIPPIYEPARGWVLRIQAAAGRYTLAVTATYQGKSVSTDKPIEVKPLVDFSILSSDKTSVMNGDNITLTLRALKKGAVINLDNLAIRINGAAASSSSVQSGTTYTVKAIVPSMSSGRYVLTAEMTNNATLYTASMNISYVSIISGNLGTKNVLVGFSKSGSTTLSFTTASDGSYTGQIIPDTYDVYLEATEAEIKIRGAAVSALNDAIKYTYDPGLTVEGFKSSGVYYVSTPWSFNTATLKLKYEPANFDGDVSVFKCGSWTNKCLGSWVKILPEINGNSINFSVSSFSAFIIGYEEKIKTTMTLDKKKYAKRDIINVKGFVTAGIPISNATIRLKIDDTYVDHTIYSDKNGGFNFDFIAPEDEGNFTMVVTAKKQPYLQYSGNYNIEVINKPSFSVVFPSTVQVVHGNKSVQDIFIVNTGQSDITGLKIAMDIDGKYYEIGRYASTLAMKQDVHVPVTFFAGEPGTTSGKLSITSNEFSQEKTFGFTTLEQPAAKVTALAVALPEMNDTVIIAVFAAVAFSAAFVLKKFRTGGFQRRLDDKPIFNRMDFPTERKQSRTSGAHGSNAQYLNEIKNHLNRRAQE